MVDPMKDAQALATRLTAVAERLESLGQTMQTEPADVPVERVWDVPPLHLQPNREAAARSRRNQFDAAVTEAGTILIALSNSGHVVDERLAAIVAACECGRSGPRFANPSNAFALYVGGPCVELIEADGAIAEYEVCGEDFPQVRPVPQRGRKMAGSTYAALDLPKPVNRDWAMKCAATCRTVAEKVGARVAERSGICDHPDEDVPEDAQPPRKGKKREPRWTTERLNTAIAHFLRENTEEVKKIGEGLEKGEIKEAEAREKFGRNAIARHLGANGSMVSKTPAYRALARILGLQGRQGKAIGFEKAAEQKALANGDSVVHAAIRQELIQEIKKVLPPNSAAAMIQKLENGKMTEEAAEEQLATFEKEHPRRARSTPGAPG